jgi:hypothetical protein
LEVFKSVSQNASLFSPFFDFCVELMKSEPLYLERDELDFIEQILEVLLAIAEQGLREPFDDTGIRFACLIFDEIFEFGPVFLLAPSRMQFTRRLLSQLNVSLRRISVELNRIDIELGDFIELVSTLAYAFDLLQSDTGYDLWSHSFDFLSFLIDFLSSNLGLISELAAIFGVLCRKYRPFIDFYSRRLEDYSDAVVLAISSSNEPIHGYFGKQITNLVLSGVAEPMVTVYFIQNCCSHLAAEDINQLVEYLYRLLSGSLGIEIAEALSALTRHHAALFLENPDPLLTPILMRLSLIGADVLVPVVRSLINLLVEGLTQASDIWGLVTKTVQGFIVQALRQDEAQGLFAFLAALIGTFDSSSDKPEAMVYYSSLFECMSNAIRPVWTIQSEQVMSHLCEFLMKGIEKGLVQNYDVILDWVSEALGACPVPEHFQVLKSIPERNEWPDGILQYILNLSSIGDEGLALSALVFVRDLAVMKWSHFFDCFDLDFLLRPLSSVDPKIVEIGLGIWERIIEQPAVRPFLPKTIESLVIGMFTNFEKVAIKMVLYLLYQVIRANLCSCEEIIRVIFSQLKFQSKEAKDFADVFSRGGAERLLMEMTMKMIKLYKKPCVS